MNPTLKTGCVIYDELNHKVYACDLKINARGELIADGIDGSANSYDIPKHYDLVITGRNPVPIVKPNGYVTFTDLVITKHSKEFIEFMFEWNGAYMLSLIKNASLKETFGSEV